MGDKRKDIELSITITAPAWLSTQAAIREVRAVFQGYPGHSSDHGEGRYLGHVGERLGIRAKTIREVIP